MLQLMQKQQRELGTQAVQGCWSTAQQGPPKAAVMHVHELQQQASWSLTCNGNMARLLEVANTGALLAQPLSYAATQSEDLCIRLTLAIPIPTPSDTWPKWVLTITGAGGKSCGAAPGDHPPAQG